MRKRTWKDFRQSFETTFGRPGLACPLCLAEFTASVQPTEDHVPPRSIGGKWTVPTCKQCNHSWARVESDLSRYFRRGNTEAGRFQGAAGILTLGGTRVRTIRRCIAQDVAAFSFLPSQTAAIDALTTKFKQGLQEAERLTLGDDPGLGFSEPLLRAAFLKAGYLALFWAFGYALVARKIYEPVREQLARPQETCFQTLIGPRSANLTARSVVFHAVLEPANKRVLIVEFEGFLTRPGDHDKISVRVHLPCPSEAALESHRRWCETVQSGSREPVRLLTQRDLIRTSDNVGWNVAVDGQMIRAFDAAADDEVERPSTITPTASKQS